MPNAFWEWFKKQNYPFSDTELWEMEWSIKRDFLLGMMIHYLYDRKQTVQPYKPFCSFREFYDWVAAGVEWNS
jgi:hypothetical protein